MGNALQGSADSHSEASGISGIKLAYKCRERQGVHQDMNLPLSVYFISSGHNSYLHGNQLSSDSGTQTITSSLKQGCRVIELDIYNMQQGFQGPVCKHGGTLTAPINLKPCVEAIRKDAFTTSPYPVIITIENHTDTVNQRQMAFIFKEVLGDLLFVPYSWERGKAWKSPEQLRGKILIRSNVTEDWAEEMKELVYIPNLKFSSLEAANKSGTCCSNSFAETAIPTIIRRAWNASGLAFKPERRSLLGSSTALGSTSTDNLQSSTDFRTGADDSTPAIPGIPAHLSSRPRRASTTSDSGREDASGLEDGRSSGVGLTRTSEQSRHLRAARNQSALVQEEAASTVPRPGYITRKVLASQPPPDADLDDISDAADSVHSLGEVYAYTARHLMRVYPSGLRINSSNYNPVRAWSLGASIVALNWQNWDKPMWINHSWFQQNGGCGYVLKPWWMRQTAPAAEDCGVDSGVPATVPANPLPPRTPFRLNVNIISAFCGHHGACSMFRSDLYVQVSVMGMPGDWGQRRTPTVCNSSQLHVDQMFEFPIQYPEVAMLMVTLWDEEPPTHGTDTLLGHWEVPVGTLATGEFKVHFTDRKNRPRQDRWVQLGLSWAGGDPADTLEADELSPKAAPWAAPGKAPVLSLPAAPSEGALARSERLASPSIVAVLQDVVPQGGKDAD